MTTASVSTVTVLVGAGVETAKWRVSKLGNNADGLSWATAWTDLDQIVWASVAAGDVIAVDGGPTRATSVYRWTSDAAHATDRPGVAGGMLYTGALSPTKDGVTIRLSTESGRDGTAVIFGGRQTALPYASQSSYSPTGTGRGRGIDLRGRTGVTIDGRHRSGIMVYGVGTSGVGIAASGIDMSTAVGCTLRNVEAFDCGSYNNTTGGVSGLVPGYVTDQEGLTLGGSGHMVERCFFHDCGQDPVQGVAAVTNLTWRDNWVFNARVHPTWAGFGFSAGSEAVAAQNATHVDGIQIYAGLRMTGHIYDHCIFGPFISKGLYPGDQDVATTDNATVSECLFLGNIVRDIQLDSYAGGGATTPSGLLIDHCTAVRTPNPATGYSGSSQNAMTDVSGTGHAIRNSVKVNGGFSGSATFTGSNSGNYYTGDAMPGGTALNPAIVQGIPDQPTWADILAANATPTNATVLAAGAGTTHIRRVQDLLDRIDTLNG